MLRNPMSAESSHGLPPVQEFTAGLNEAEVIAPSCSTQTFSSQQFPQHIVKF
jgi:hypothetical protein